MVSRLTDKRGNEGDDEGHDLRASLEVAAEPIHSIVEPVGEMHFLSLLDVAAARLTIP